MDRDLHDLRLLKLAEMYEEAYEGFVLGVAERMVEDPAIRQKLLALVSPTDRHHERILEQMQRLQARLTPEAQAGMLRAALLDVCDVERSARDFYLKQADQVHDGNVAKLFRQLAREEEGHLRVAEEALRLAQQRHLRAAPDERVSDMFRLLGADDGTPLREGVSDFGHRHHPNPGPGS